MPAPNCKCGRKAVYFRKYEGLHYCKLCFCKSVEKKFRRTVGKYKLARFGDRIAVGLSGGKDSSAVLHLMHHLAKRRKGLEVFAISIDEGIESYRPDTLKMAKELCKKLGVKHHIYSFKRSFGKGLDKKLSSRKDACTYCGVGRRTMLNKAARELKATKLCVGHNLDDESQSVLMNFMRGDLLRAGRMGTLTDESSRKGAGFVPRIKPLRFIPEKETALYAILKGLPYSDTECPYIGGMRPEVREFLNDMENRYTGTKFALLDSYDKISPHIKKSVSYKRPLQECRKCKEPSSKEVCKTCELWK